MPPFSSDDTPRHSPPLRRLKRLLDSWDEDSAVHLHPARGEPRRDAARSDDIPREPRRPAVVIRTRRASNDDSLPPALERPRQRGRQHPYDDSPSIAPQRSRYEVSVPPVRRYEPAPSPSPSARPSIIVRKGKQIGLIIAGIAAGLISAGKALGLW